MTKKEKETIKALLRGACTARAEALAHIGLLEAGYSGITRREDARDVFWKRLNNADNMVDILSELLCAEGIEIKHAYMKLTEEYNNKIRKGNISTEYEYFYK